jgi:hypothetical protein
MKMDETIKENAFLSEASKNLIKRNKELEIAIGELKSKEAFSERDIC